MIGAVLLVFAIAGLIALLLRSRDR